MAATIDNRKPVLNEAQNTWLKQMADVLKVPLGDTGVAPGTSQGESAIGDGVKSQAATAAGNTLDGFPNASPSATPDPPVPLSQSKTPQQPAVPLQKKTPVPVPGAPPKDLKPVVFKRTTQIGNQDQTKRKEKLAISSAKTVEDVTRIVEDKRGINGLPTAKLDAMSKILREADRAGNSRVPVDMVPDAVEIKQIREKYAKLNSAIANGNFEEAAKITRELGLPITDKQLQAEAAKAPDELTNLNDKQWKTLLALGAATFNASKKSKPGGGSTLHWDRAPNIGTFPNPNLSALNGVAGYVQLVDDMAAHGVDPLSAPPTQEQMNTYLEQVRVEADRKAQIDFPSKPDEQKRASSDALLNASQRLMDGMQVHYRGASRQDMEYGATSKWSIFLFRGGKIVTRSDGKPVTLELDSEPDKRKFEEWKARNLSTINKFQRDNGGGEYWISTTKTPEGFGDNTSRDVFGNRHESDCEGMASFRLRTLPPGFKKLGVVSGRMKTGGIGHMVAVFQSPDGRVFLSSNGKVPIEVKPRGTNMSGDDIRFAVVDEFRAIYQGNHAESDFSLGMGTPESFTGSPMDVANQSTDRVLKDASNDDNLRSAVGRPKEMPELNWDRLVPPRSTQK